MNEKKSKALKIINIISNVFLYIFFAISMVLLVLSISAKKDSDGAVRVLGFELRVVVSESMERHEDTYKEIKKYRIKSLPIKTLVLIKTVPTNEEKAEKWYDKIKVGDVLTFKYVFNNKQETVTHRVIEKNENLNNDGYNIVLRGDNKGTKSQPGKQIIDTSADLGSEHNYIIGKVIAKSFIIGLLITALKSPIGIVFLVIIPCLVIIIFEVVKIVNYFNGEKKKKVKEEADKQKDEIEELKRKLEELSKTNSSDENANVTSE